MPEILNRATAIPNHISPTGRKFNVFPWEPNPGLWEIKFDDNKPGELPTELRDMKYTGKNRALAELHKYLTKFWDMSDSKNK